MNEKRAKIIELQNEAERRKILSEKIQKNFDFEIPTYVLEDIIDEEYFEHICLMINLATLNNRISKENSIRLKEKLKEIYNINSIYDSISIN